MLGCLLVHGVDQLQGAARIMARVGGRVYPYGKELGAQIAFARRLKIDVTTFERIGQVITVIEHALGGVGVGVDNDGGVVHG